MFRLNEPVKSSRADFVLFGLIIASLLFMLAYQLTGLNDEFAAGYAIEDGPVEWGTAVGLFLSAIVLFHNGCTLWAKRGAVAAATTLFYGIVFIFGMGEEISWGQRIFGWETDGYFAENNVQNETNLHNLLVGEEQLTKTLFGPALTVIILLYLVVLPVLYPRYQWVKNVVRIFTIPVPAYRHALAAIGASLLIAAVDLDRKWEVYELIFSLLTVSIFLMPQNAQEVAPTNRRGESH